MKPEILMMGPMMPHVEAALDDAYTVHRIFQTDDADAMLAEAGPRIRGIATDGGKGASADVMARLPALEIVSCYGVGTDAIDLDHARGRSVTVTNTPDVLNDDVANMAVALVLATSRTLVANGLGRIGKDIADKLGAFGCVIAYHGRSEQDVPYEYFADLTDMARAVDFLIAICPGGPSTNGIVYYAVLKMDNVILQPHQGSGTIETRRAMGDLVIENLGLHFAGRPVKTPVG
jgi:lactate dehydrogenase-like 2-hydroxyacid dehydrogenase